MNQEVRPFDISDVLPLLADDDAAVISRISRQLSATPEAAELLEFYVAFSRRRLRAKRREKPECWVVAAAGSNSAARARQIASESSVRILYLQNNGPSLEWPTTATLALRRVAQPADLVLQAFDLALEAPCCAVYLAGTGPGEILLGLFCKLLWDARVVTHLPPIEPMPERPAQWAAAFAHAVREGREDRTIMFAALTALDPEYVSEDMTLAAGKAQRDRPLPPPDVLLSGSALDLFSALGNWQAVRPIERPQNTFTGGNERITVPPTDNTKVIVYSVLLDGFGEAHPPLFRDPDVLYLLFTDKPGYFAEGWEVVPFDTLGLSPGIASGLPKLLPHLYLPEHEISIYLDLSLTPAERDMARMAQDLVQDCDLAAYPQGVHNCIYDVTEECVQIGEVELKHGRAFMAGLKNENFPANWGLLDSGFMVRRNSALMRRINELWFKQFIGTPGPDSVSLMPVLWRASIPFAVIKNATRPNESIHIIPRINLVTLSPKSYLDAKKLAKSYPFLNEIKPTALKIAAKRAVVALEKKKGGQPSVSSKRMRTVLNAIALLDLQNRPEAQACRYQLSYALFPKASPFQVERPLKLAYITSSALPTAAANNVHFMKMCSAFAEIDTDIVLYAERAEGNDSVDSDALHERFGTRASFPFVLLEKDKTGRENLMYNLVRRAIADGCTHIYTRSLEAAVFAAIADVPFFFEEHKVSKDVQFPYQSFIARSSALAGMIVISTPLKRALCGLKQSISRKIAVLPDAADPPQKSLQPFDFSPQKGGRIRVGYVGHLYPGKGAELCYELARRMPELDFHLLGGVPEDVEAWQDKARDLPNMILHGHRPHKQVPDFIEAVDICIAPFLRTVFARGGTHNIADVFSPLKIFEYMAHGKPIVASDLPVLREVLTDDETALLCDPDRPETFVAALKRLIADPQIGQRLGYAARARFDAEFTWTKRAQKIRNMIAKSRTRIEPPVLANARRSPARARKPIVRWYYGGEKQTDWAYGINARRLSSRIESCDHIAPGSSIPASSSEDVALAFDILLMSRKDFLSSPASRRILRVGGPKPLQLASGGNLARLAELMTQADAVIALSPQLRDELSELHPSVHFIPNGIDLDAFHPNMRQLSGSARFTVGMAASMDNDAQRHIKGYQFAIDACNAAGVELLMIGRGIKQVAHERLVEDFYSKIDVLIHPVDAGKEASSNVIMEALALGVPVVTTRHAGFHGVALENGREGLLMRRTVADLANAIRALRADRNLYDQLREGGRAFAERHHALDVIAQQYENVIWNCLRSPKENEKKITVAENSAERKQGTDANMPEKGCDHPSASKTANAT